MDTKRAIMRIFPEIPEFKEVDFSQYSTPYGALLMAFLDSGKTGLREFEEFVEEEFRAPIYHVAELLLVGYQRASEKFLKAFNAMMDSLSGHAEAVVGAHLVYYRRSNIIVSPVVGTLLKLLGEKKIAVVDYVDDYYHVLFRVAERVAEGRTPEVTGFQILDPVGLLHWRSSHHSVTQLLALSGAATAVYASKHTSRGHVRLIAKLLGRKAENGRGYETVYISHPITKVRERALRENTPLSQHPDALDIERFKNILEERTDAEFDLDITKLDIEQASIIMISTTKGPFFWWDTADRFPVGPRT
jgi:hypothetical protein